MGIFGIFFFFLVARLGFSISIDNCIDGLVFCYGYWRIGALGRGSVLIYFCRLVLLFLIHRRGGLFVGPSPLFAKGLVFFLFYFYFYLGWI